jgi:hypothetical protein
MESVVLTKFGVAVLVVLRDIYVPASRARAVVSPAKSTAGRPAAESTSRERAPAAVPA